MNQIDWLATLHLNAVRIIAASIVICVAALVTQGIPEGQGIGFVFGLLIGAPIAVAIFVLSGFAVSKIAGWFGGSAGTLIAGAAALMGILIAVIGDPLIWAVRFFYPQIVPVERFNIINPHAVIAVYRATP